MQTEIGKQTQIWEKSAKRRLLAIMAVIIVALLGFAGWKEYLVSLPQRINELKRLDEIVEGSFKVAFACHDGNSGMFWMSSSETQGYFKFKVGYREDRISDVFCLRYPTGANGSPAGLCSME